jgi:hypothetical protein
VLVLSAPALVAAATLVIAVMAAVLAVVIVVLGTHMLPRFSSDSLHSPVCSGAA